MNIFSCYTEVRNERIKVKIQLRKKINDKTDDELMILPWALKKNSIQCEGSLHSSVL